MPGIQQTSTLYRFGNIALNCVLHMVYAFCLHAHKPECVYKPNERYKVFGIS